MAKGAQVWFNGETIPTEKATVSLYTHCLHYGVGVFEGIRVYAQPDGNGAVFRLKEHMERFLESLKILGLKSPYSLDQLIHAAVELVNTNGFSECYIRPIAYVAEGPLGIYIGEEPPVHVAILNWEWGRYLGEEGIANGIRLKTSSFSRPQVNSIMTKGKINGQYVASVLAKQEAIHSGYDEALFLDVDGYVAEGTGENIFMVKNGAIKTTPLTSVLNGITRRSIIDYLGHQEIGVQEVRFSRDELWCADEVFLCGTAAEVTPVREIDDRQIGAGKPGPLTQKVQQAYLNIVKGLDVPEYAKPWLTPLK